MFHPEAPADYVLTSTWDWCDMAAEDHDPYEVLALKTRYLSALLEGSLGWLNAFTVATEEARDADGETAPDWNEKQAQRVTAAHAAEVMGEKVLSWVIEDVAAKLEEGAEPEDIVAEVEKRGGDLDEQMIQKAKEVADARRAFAESQARPNAHTGRVVVA